MPLRSGLWGGAYLLLATLLGCISECPKPLAPQAVDAALTPPPVESLQVQARAIRHPILHPVEFDLHQGLTPDQAAVLAVLANPSLRAARDEQGIAQAQLLQAGLLPNPELSGAFEAPFAGPDHFNAFSLGLNWEFTSLITQQAKVAAAATKVDSVRLDVAWQEWQVAEAAKLAVYRLISTQRQLALARQVDLRLGENLALVRDAVSKGFKTALDLAAAEAASQEAHTTVLELEHDLRKAQLTLNKSLGLPSDVAMPVRSDLEFPAELKDLPAADELLQGLEDRRLDLMALKLGYNSQEATLRAAVLGQFPKMSLRPMGGRDTANSQTLGAEGTMDLPLFDRNQGNIAIEKATRQKLFDEYVNRVFEARSEVAQLLSDIQSVTQEIRHAEAGVPILERVVRLYEAAMRQGNVDILSYYSARNDLAKKRIDVLKLKQELVENRISLEIAAGEYLAGATATQPSLQPASQEAN